MIFQCTRMAVLRIQRGFWRLRNKPLEFLPDAPTIFSDYRRLLKCSDVQRQPGGWKYKGAFYPDYLTVGGASYAIRRRAQEFCKGVGVDVGAGLWPLPGAIPVDTERGPGVNRKIGDFQDGSLDYIFSSHCLEHIRLWEDEIALWIKKIKPAGIIFLYLPHPDCVIGHPHSPFVQGAHQWQPTRALVVQALTKGNCEVVACDDGPDAMFSFFVCAQKRK